MSRRAAAFVLAVALAAGCTPTPPPPRPTEADLTRTVPLAPAAAEERLRSAASSLGLVADADGSFEGPARDGAATCPRFSTRLQSGETAQSREARLQSVRVRIVPILIPSGDATRIVLQPTYVGRMLDTLNYVELDVRCTPTGAFERALLDAVVAGG
jgi:hypothetical protein